MKNRIVFGLVLVFFKQKPLATNLLRRLKKTFKKKIKKSIAVLKKGVMFAPAKNGKSVGRQVHCPGVFSG
ncbi:hypothetical protein, partial [Tamlana flava]|uniref:hypothetical protein n=1 Tax=Tamlana flava TaxID=3158572 RepID=UPI00351BE756